MKTYQHQESQPPSVDVCHKNSGQTITEISEIEVPAEEPRYLCGWRLATLTLGLAVTVLLIGLDGSIIATATSKITSQFNSLDQSGWYGSAYLLTMVVFQPLCGRLYSDFNAKWTFLSGLVVFEIGSTLCATARSSIMLIVGRPVAGGGASALFHGGFTIIGLCLPVAKRPIYIAGLSSIFGLCDICAPILGGFLTDRLSWRWCFWIDLPFGAVAAVTNVFCFRAPARAPNGLKWYEVLARLEIPSTVLLSGCLNTAFLGLQQAGTIYPWRDAHVWGMLTTSCLLLLAFLCMQICWSPTSYFPRRIFLQRTVLVKAKFSMLLSMAVNTHAYFLPYYFQAVKGMSAESSGISTAAYVLSSTSSALLVGATTTKTGKYTPFLWSGSCLFTLGAALLVTLRTQSSTNHYVGYEILAGAGSGACAQIPFIAVPNVLSASDLATGNALVLFANALGGAIAVSLAQCIFLNVLHMEIPRRTTITDPMVIISAGATKWRELVPASQAPGVITSRLLSTRGVFILALSAGSLAFLCSLMIENRRICATAHTPPQQLDTGNQLAWAEKASNPEALLRLPELTFAPIVPFSGTSGPLGRQLSIHHAPTHRRSRRPSPSQRRTIKRKPVGFTTAPVLLSSP